MDLNCLKAAFAQLPVAHIDYFDSIDSTNSHALKLADLGVPEPALVVADTQTSGRGRMNRRWITNPGSALAFSLLLHPKPEEQSRLQLFSALASLAVCKVLLNTYQLNTQIKWPNDILIDRKKTAGILSEAVWSGDHLQAVVIGVGLNVTRGALPQQNDLQFPATCLEDHLSEPVDRVDLLVKIVSEILSIRDSLGTETFMQDYNRRLAFHGEQVRIIMGESITVGRLTGTDPLGNLILTAGDDELVISAGDLHLRPEPAENIQADSNGL